MTPNDAMRNADQGMVARGDDKTLRDCVSKTPLLQEIPSKALAEENRPRCMPFGPVAESPVLPACECLVDHNLEVQLRAWPFGGMRCAGCGGSLLSGKQRVAAAANPEGDGS